jgi:hypothetical protein
MNTPTTRRLKLTLGEIAVLEAARRALGRATKGKHFDLELFEAMAEHELKKLRKEINETNKEQDNG